jgi:hypothetical protein
MRNGIKNVNKRTLLPRYFWNKLSAVPTFLFPSSASVAQFITILKQQTLKSLLVAATKLHASRSQQNHATLQHEQMGPGE